MYSTVQTKTRSANAGNEAPKWKKHVGVEDSRKTFTKRAQAPGAGHRPAAVVCVVA